MGKKYWLILFEDHGGRYPLSKWASLPDAKLELRYQLRQLEYGYDMIDGARQRVRQYPYIKIVKMPDNIIVE